MLNRWEIIKQSLHFNDNSAQIAKGNSDFDELFKIRRPITHLVKKMSGLPMTEK